MSDIRGGQELRVRLDPKTRDAGQESRPLTSPVPGADDLKRVRSGSRTGRPSPPAARVWFVMTARSFDQRWTSL